MGHTAGTEIKIVRRTRCGFLSICWLHLNEQVSNRWLRRQSLQSAESPLRFDMSQRKKSIAPGDFLCILQYLSRGSSHTGS